jgi:transcriptional regulator with XRE-family HTH domain
MNQSLGKQISTRRKAMGLTQDQLAEKLGVTAQAVSKWENDQSCPDITTLPRLAEIFGISVDTLLGRTEQEIVHEATIENNQSDEDSDVWDYIYDKTHRSGIGFALFIFSCGVLWLLSNLLELNVGLWSIAWPTALLTIGAMGLLRKFTFLRLMFAMLGAYFLLGNFSLLPDALLDKNLLLPVFLVIFGAGLLLDIFRKPKNRKFHFVKRFNHKDVSKNHCQISADHFDFSASFSEKHNVITMEVLRYGSISTSFGEYTIDLSGVKSVKPGCELEVSNSFGALTLLVPSRFQLLCDNSTAFGDIDIKGCGTGIDGTITLDASCSFGEINIRYI